MTRPTLNDIRKSRYLREQMAVGLFLHANPWARDTEHIPVEGVSRPSDAWYEDALNQADTSFGVGSGVSNDEREAWASIGVDASCVPVDVAIRENNLYGTVTGISMEDVVDDMVIRGQTLTHRQEETYPVLRDLTLNDGESWATGL